MLTCIVGSTAWGQSGADYYFEQGNQAYRNNNFAGAIEWYQRIPATGFGSAAVYYNLGNCYFRLNQIGAAIQYYEKALKLAPGDPETLSNLELARARTVDRIEPLPSFFLFAWWAGIKNFFNSSELTILLIAAYLLSIGLLIAMLFLPEKFRKPLLYSTIFTGVVTVFSAYLLFSQIRADQQFTEAVVLAPSARVFSAPNDTGTDIFVLHEGTKLTMSDERGEWVRIALIDGKTGWMHSADLGEI